MHALLFEMKDDSGGTHALVLWFLFCMCVKVCVWKFSSHFLCLSPLSFALLSVSQKVSSDSLLYNHWPQSFPHLFLFFSQSVFSPSQSGINMLESRGRCVKICPFALLPVFDFTFLCAICSVMLWFVTETESEAAPLRLDQTLLIFLCRLVQIQIQHVYYILKEMLQWHHLYYVFIYRCTLWLKFRLKCEALLIVQVNGSYLLNRCTWTLRVLKGTATVFYLLSS